MNRGNFDGRIHLSARSWRDINWCYDNIDIAVKHLRQPPPSVELYTDASLTIGWGATLCYVKTGGNWSSSDKNTFTHINQLELYAVYLAIKSFTSDLRGQHVKIHIDNSTAVACINNFGSTKSDACNSLTRDIWDLAIKLDMFITATHIKGILNTAADTESRRIRTETEWMLCKDIFHKITNVYFEPSIDMFASRLNHQVNEYISWIPDPDSVAVDALTCNWIDFNKMYIFCPFSIIHRVTQKLLEDGAEAILIIPDWPTASWYPLVMRMCIVPPRLLPRKKRLLHLPQQPDAVHPLHMKLRLLACHVSGKHFNNKAYQKAQFQLL